MMPLGKDNNRRIYITALVISFLLIVGSIYLHLKQKTHLGRMSFNLDRDLVKPTTGVEPTTWMDEEYDLEHEALNETNKHFNSEENVEQYSDILEADDDDDDVLIEDSNEIERNIDDNVENLSASIDKIIADFNGDFKQNSENELKSIEGHNDIFEASSPEDYDDYAHDDLTEESDEIEGNNEYQVDNLSATIDDNGSKQNSEYKLKSLEQDSAACLRCLCMTVNKCHPTFCGSGNPCGLYRISKSYWIDAGRPTIEGGTTDNEDQDYLTCVNEDTCSTTVIRQYYNRYKRDCNKDDKFDCHDQVALHLLGPTDCLTKDLSYLHASRLKNCLIESNLNYFSYSEEEYK